MVGEPLDRQEPREVLRQQPKHLRLVRFAQQVHAPLGVASRVREARAQVRGEAREVGRRVEQAIVEQLVEQQRMARDELGRPARGADDPRHALQRVRMLGE